MKSERKRLGLSQEAFSALGGSSKPSQVRYESGERSPDGLYLSALAAHGVDVLFVLTGLRSRRSAAMFGQLADLAGIEPLKLPSPVQGTVGGEASGHASGLSESGDNDSLPIPWFEPRLGQGSAPVRFSRDWLLAMDLPIERLRAVLPDEFAFGLDGGPALALIEEPSTPGPQPELWAVRDGTRVVIARLQRSGEIDVLLPARPSLPARVYRTSEFAMRPLGRVLWLSVLRP